MPCPLLIVSQSEFLIQIVDINPHTEWQTVQIQISWLLQKPTDLDLHCLQDWVYPGSAGKGLKDWAAPYKNESSGICGQQRPRSACAPMLSGQGLWCPET